MNSQPATTVWLHILILAAAEIGLVTLAVAAVRVRMLRPASRRNLCQAAMVSCLLIAVGEFSGLSRGVVAWMGLTRERKELPLASDGHAGTSDRLSAGFRSEVENRVGSLRRSAVVKPGGREGKFFTIPGATPVDSTAKSLGERMPENFSIAWIAAGWLAGSAAVFGRSVVGAFVFWALSLRGRRTVQAELRDRIQGLARRLGIARRVRVWVLPRLHCPIAYGMFRPAIGLPEGFVEKMDGSRRDAILAHELAHIAAHDPFWRWVANITAALLWWHPGIWWVRRQLWMASEMAADEASLLVSDGPRNLAESLVVLGNELVKPRFMLQVEMAGFRSQLGTRVQHLLRLEGSTFSEPRERRWGLLNVIGPVALAAIVIVCTAWAAPRALTREQTMKSVQLNWKRSVATLALLGSINAPEVAVPAVRAAAPGPEAPPIRQPAIPNEVLEEYSNIISQVADWKRKDRELAEQGYQPVHPLRAPLSGQIAKLNERQGDLLAQYPALSDYRRGGAPMAFNPGGGSGPTAGPMPRPDRPAAPFPPGQGPVLQRDGMIPGERVDDEARRRIFNKLVGITLPEVMFDGLPLSEALKYLSEEARKLDPEKQGVNFLINPNDAFASAGAPGGIDPATGLPLPASVEAVDLSSITVKFNLPLRNVRLKDLLDAIGKVAERPLQYGVEDYGVVFSLKPVEAGVYMPRPGPAQPAGNFLIARTFRVDTNTFVAGLENAFGIKIDSSEKEKPRSRKILAALKNLLSELGIAMEGKSIFYNELTGVLMVRGSENDLQVIEAAVETLGGHRQESGAGFTAPGGMVPR